MAEYRKIKTFDNYEMSKDGKKVREVSSKKELKILPHPGKTKTGVKLSDSEGNEKVYGLASLYRKAWNKGHPSLPEYKNPKAAKAAKEARKVRRALKRRNRVQKNQIFSDHIRDVLFEMYEKHIEKNTYICAEHYKDHPNVVRFVLPNSENDMAVLHVKSQSWRDGYWFYNFTTGGYERFDNKKHRRDGKLGHENILWPKI